MKVSVCLAANGSHDHILSYEQKAHRSFYIFPVKKEVCEMKKYIHQSHPFQIPEILSLRDKFCIPFERKIENRAINTLLVRIER